MVVWLGQSVFGSYHFHRLKQKLGGVEYKLGRKITEEKNTAEGMHWIYLFAKQKLKQSPDFRDGFSIIAFI